MLNMTQCAPNLNLLIQLAQGCPNCGRGFLDTAPRRTSSAQKRGNDGEDSIASPDALPKTGLDKRCTSSHSTGMLPFVVELQPGISVFEQLVFSVQKAIVSKQLLPGDRFPSVRTISQELRINPNTAQKAVTKLVAQGHLVVQPGVGTLIARLPEPSARERTALLVREVEQLVVESRRLSVPLEQLIEAVRHQWMSLSEGHPPQDPEHAAAKELDVA